MSMAADRFRFYLPAVSLLAVVLCAALGVFAGTGDSASLQPADSPLSLADFRQELGRLQQSVNGLGEHPERIGEVRQALPKSWKVERDGQVMEVSADWIAASLTTMETTGAVRRSLEKDIENHLQRLLEEAQELESAGGEESREKARAQLEQILRQREFQEVHQPGWFELAWTRFWRGVGRLLGRLLGGMGARPSTRKILVWSVIGIVFVLLVVVLRRAAMRAWATPALDLEAAPLPSRNWRDWAKEALSAARRGDYRDAVHRCYWAGVYRLEELGVWDLDRARTPREYLRLLWERQGAPVALLQRQARAGTPQSPESGKYREALEALTGSLEHTWYGGQEAGPEEFRLSVERLEALGCRFPSSQRIAGS